MNLMETIVTVGISGSRSTPLNDGQFVHSPLSCASVDRDRRRAGMALDLRELGVFGVRGGAPSNDQAGEVAYAAADLGNPAPRLERRQLLPIQIKGKSRVPPGSCERRRLATG